MIYLQNISESQVMFVPKDGATASGSLVFKAKSTIDNEEKINADVVDLNTSSQYYNISVTLPDGLPTGEYEYSLFKGGVLVSTGVLVLVSENSTSQYNKDLTYEQYNS